MYATTGGARCRERRVKGLGASEVVGPSALPFELFRVELLQPRIRVDVVGPLVVSDPHDAGKAQGEPARVMRTPLDLVVRDLDDDLRTDMVAPSLFGGREPAKALRHRLELC